MVGVILTFQYGDDFDRTRVEGVAQRARQRFEGLAGLRYKVFALDPDARRAINVYIWDSREAAEAFFTPELADEAAGFYGVQPSIEFLEVAGLVDNSRSSEAAAV